MQNMTNLKSEHSSFNAWPTQIMYNLMQIMYNLMHKSCQGQQFKIVHLRTEVFISKQQKMMPFNEAGVIT